MSQVGNHVPYLGLIQRFRNSTFKEYLIEIDRNDYVYSDDGEESLFSFGEIRQTVKKELVYVEE